MNRIIQKKSVLRKLPYTELKPFHNFFPLTFYDTTRYEWAHIHYKKNWTTFRPNTHTNKNSPTWADKHTHLEWSLFNKSTNNHRFQIPLEWRNDYSHKSYNDYRHIIDSGFPWPRTRWTYCTIILGIILHFILVTHVQKISPFDYFMINESHFKRVRHRFIHTTPRAS